MNAGYEIEPFCARYGWVNMFKVIDLPGFIREVATLLERRLQTSVNDGWRGSISIKGLRLVADFAVEDGGRVNIEDKPIKHPDIQIITDDKTITSLVSSGLDVWEAYRQHNLTVKPMFNERTRRLIEALFPKLPCRQSGWW